MVINMNKFVLLILRENLAQILAKMIPSWMLYQIFVRIAGIAYNKYPTKLYSNLTVKEISHALQEKYYE